MFNTYPKFKDQLNDCYDTQKIGEMPTVINQQENETPNFDLLYDKKVDINIKFYEEINNFDKHFELSLPTDTGQEKPMIKKKILK